MTKLYKASSDINKTGLYTKSALTKGDHVAYIDGPIVVYRKFTPAISKGMLNWIGVSKYSWINTNKSLFRFINHSCDPNVAQISARKVIAVKDIPAGTELHMDYSLTEAEPDWKIGPCTCGSKNCRGYILSIDKLPPNFFRKHKDHIPKVFKAIYDATH